MTDLEKLSDRELRTLLRSRYHYVGSYMMARTREWDTARDEFMNWMVRTGGDVL